MKSGVRTFKEIALLDKYPAIIREPAHADCVVCGSSNRQGLRLLFVRCADGSVCAAFQCPKAFQGYGDYLHGGVISSILDGAMTNCLFAHGQVAFTAELNIRFLHPVGIGEPGMVRAWIDRPHPIMNVLKAEIIQGEQVMATAVGKFIKRNRHNGKRNDNVK